MAQLQSTNVTGVLCVNGVAVGGGKDFKYCCITSTGTWTPSSDLVDGDGVVDTLIVGAGGGSGAVRFYTNGQSCATINANAYSAAGGGASVWKGITDIDSTDACTVTIGAGGDGAHFTSANTTVNASEGGFSAFASKAVGGGGGGNSQCMCCYTNGAASYWNVVGNNSYNGGYGALSPGGGAGFVNGYRIGTSTIGDRCCYRYGIMNNYACTLANQDGNGGTGIIYNSQGPIQGTNSSTCQYYFTGPNSAFQQYQVESHTNKGLQFDGEWFAGGGNNDVRGNALFGFSTNSGSENEGYTRGCWKFDSSDTAACITNAGTSFPVTCIELGNTASQVNPTTEFGVGAPSINLGFCKINNITVDGVKCMHGLKGNDGIVVLKWYE